MTSGKFNFEAWFSEITAPFVDRLEEANRKVSQGIDELLSKSNEQPAAYCSWSEMNKLLSSKADGAITKNPYPKGIRIGCVNHRDLSDKKKSAGVPICLPILHRKGMLIEDHGSGHGTKLMSSTALRLLLSTPPGSVHFYLIDAMTMGRAFSSLGNLDPVLATLCDPTEESILDLLRSLETRITDINRRCLAKASSLLEFNEQNLEQREVLHLICAANFPHGFSREAQISLARILSHENGARAGIHFIATSDQSFDSAYSGLPTVRLSISGESTITDSPWLDTLGNEKHKLLCFQADAELPTETDALVDYINARTRSGQTKRVRITFDEEMIWKGSGHRGITVPIGRTSGHVVNFTLGNEAVVHNALIGGAVGTGKTVLLHNLIANAALTYSPEELQMVLLDYKEGTEFAVYKELPHVRILSIASEIDFGLKVFEWLVQEKSRRATEFKRVGRKDFEDYRRLSGLDMPRIMVVIDEFQRLLISPLVGFQVGSLLDDIVRTGRGFGFNLVLATQSLANVYNFETSTKSNIGLRICLRMSEAEASSFLSHDNTVPARFTQAGHAVYNNAEGQRAANTEFQVGYLDTAELEAICTALQSKEQDTFGKSIITDRIQFSGDMPAAIADMPLADEKNGLCAWLGSALAIHAPTVRLNLPQSDGGNAIVIAGNAECLRTICINTVFQVMKTVISANIWVLDALHDGQEAWGQHVTRGINLITTTQNGQKVLSQWQLELQERVDAGERNDWQPWLLFLIEGHASRLFSVDSYGDPSETAIQFQKILQDGPRHSMHVILAGTRWTRIEKAFGHNTLKSLGVRIIMKSDDGAALLGVSGILEIGPFTGYLRDEQTLDGPVAFQLFDRINDNNVN